MRGYYILKKIFLFILTLIFTSQTVFAIGDIKKIDLKEAIEIAKVNNLDIKASKIDIDIAKNEIKKADRLQNPDIDVFYNFGKAGKGNPQQIGLSQTVEIGKRGARKNLAKSNLLNTENNFSFEEFDLGMDVREAYINLVASKSILKNLVGQQKLFEELVEIAETKVKTGELPEIDLIQAKIALNQMITRVNSARMTAKAKGLEFNKVINSKLEDYDSIDDFFPDSKDFLAMMTPSPDKKLPDFELIKENSLKNRLDLKIARQEIDIAEKKLSVVTGQRIPDLLIKAGYGYQPEHLSDDGTFRPGAYVGASLVNLPILYNYSPEIKNAELEVKQAKLKYESCENKALKDLQRTYEQFLTSKENLNFYNQKLVKESKNMIEISKKDYSTGKANLTSLIVMEQSYEEIIEGYTNAIAEYYKSWIAFLREMNTEEFDFDTETI